MNGVQDCQKLESVQSVSQPIGTKKKKGVIKKCVVCDKEFYVLHYRKDTARCCSKKCDIYLRKKEIRGSFFNCIVCGKLFYKFPSIISSGWSVRHCSQECRENGDYNENQKLEASKCWKGGEERKNGYVYVRIHNHPYKNKKNQIAQHRLVMEKHLGRYLSKNESVHHKNGIKDDNRIENLEVVIKKLHYGHVECPHCQKSFLIK